MNCEDYNYEAPHNAISSNLFFLTSSILKQPQPMLTIQRKKTGLTPRYTVLLRVREVPCTHIDPKAIYFD
jgi:hypothetical protein